MLRTLRHIPLFRICFLQNTLFSFPSKMKNSLKMSSLWLNHETQKPLSIVNKVSCYICCNNCATYHIYTRKPKSTNHTEKLNNLHLFFILVRYSFQLKLFWRHTLHPYDVSICKYVCKLALTLLTMDSGYYFMVSHLHRHFQAVLLSTIQLKNLTLVITLAGRSQCFTGIVAIYLNLFACHISMLHLEQIFVYHFFPHFLTKYDFQHFYQSQPSHAPLCIIG